MNIEEVEKSLVSWRTLTAVSDLKVAIGNCNRHVRASRAKRFGLGADYTVSENLYLYLYRYIPKALLFQQ